MKTQFYYLFVLIVMMWGSLTTAMAQEEVNPFPLSEQQKEKLLEKSKKTIEKYKAKYSSADLSTWSEKDRNAYLKAKAIKVILLFAPDFYRDYKEPEIIREYSGAEDPVFKNKPLYRLNFFYDPKRETFSSYSKGIIIKVSVWEENGEAEGFLLPSYNWGDFFRPPLWEDGLYQKRKQNNDTLHLYRYRTGLLDRGL